MTSTNPRTGPAKTTGTLGPSPAPVLIPMYWRGVRSPLSAVEPIELLRHALHLFANRDAFEPQDLFVAMKYILWVCDCLWFYQEFTGEELDARKRLTVVSNLLRKCVAGGEKCWACGARKKWKCVGCMSARYCSFACRDKDWKNHKSACGLREVGTDGGPCEPLFSPRRDGRFRENQRKMRFEEEVLSID